MAATRAHGLSRDPAQMLGLTRTRPDAIELLLEADETWSGGGRAPWVEVRCLSGVAWVTVEGDVEDHVLSAGDSFVSARQGRVAVMALEPARLRVRGCSTRRPVEKPASLRAPAAT